MPRTILAALAAALVAAAALPAAASAGELSYDGNTIVYKASSGEENFVTLSVDDPGKLAVSDSGASQLTYPGDRCDRISEDYPLQCDMPSGFKADLNDRDDRFFSAYMVPSSLAVSVVGGDGTDELKGGEDHNSTLDGGAGNDKLESQDADDTLIGGPGNDELLGSGGSDKLMAGEGDDYLRPDTNSANPGDDLVDGGPGIDRVDDWVDNASSGTQRPVTITLDGVANDGRGSERDDVRDIEEIESYVGGTYVLSDGAERVEHYAASDRAAATFELRGGDDVIFAGVGAQVINGGAGNDSIEAGFGDDNIVGGPGRDVIAADFTGSQCGLLQSCTIPHGNDVVDVRDGEADTVDCGVGEDRVVADPQDTVSNCETVDAGQSGNDGTNDQNQVVNNGPGNQAGSSIVLARRTGLRTALRRGLKVRIAVAPGADVAARALHGRRTVGRGRARAGTDGSATVTVRFTKAAKRSLARKRRVKLTIVAGTASAAVTLKR